MTNKINTEDISVIVQGAINKKITKECLQSIRKHLPQSEIILATWEGSDISNLEYDKVILNKDPGAISFTTDNKSLNNINRMILGVNAGLEKASKKYVLKIRSDMIMKTSNFLDQWGKYEKRSEKYQLFKNRIMAYPYFSLKFHKSKNKIHYQPFHISDWCYFGVTDDLKTLYDVDLVKEPDFSRYFEINKIKTKNIDLFKDVLWQYPPEQYITYQCFKKHFENTEFKHKRDYNEDNIKVSEIFIINNFKIPSIKEWGIINKKNFNYQVRECFSKPLTLLGLYDKLTWESDYKKYCNNDYKISTFTRFKSFVFKNCRITKHLNSIIKYYISFKKRSNFKKFAICLPKIIIHTLLALIKPVFIALSVIFKRK